MRLVLISLEERSQAFRTSSSLNSVFEKSKELPEQIASDLKVFLQRVKAINQRLAPDAPNGSIRHKCLVLAVRLSHETIQPLGRYSTSERNLLDF